MSPLRKGHPPPLVWPAKAWYPTRNQSGSAAGAPSKKEAGKERQHEGVQDRGDHEEAGRAGDERHGPPGLGGREHVLLELLEDLPPDRLRKRTVTPAFPPPRKQETAPPGLRPGGAVLLRFTRLWHGRLVPLPRLLPRSRTEGALAHPA